MQIEKEILEYNKKLDENDREICDLILNQIKENLKSKEGNLENKIWHRHPVWFVDGNPVVGYSKLKDCVRLLFWSGESFEDNDLKTGSGKFKDASISFTNVKDINVTKIKKWLKKAIEIQWDYKNIVKRKGVLIRLK
jgi:hypothetical protein